MSPRALRATLGLVTGLLATLLYLGVRGTGPVTGPSALERFGRRVASRVRVLVPYIEYAEPMTVRA